MTWRASDSILGPEFFGAIYCDHRAFITGGLHRVDLFVAAYHWWTSLVDSSTDFYWEYSGKVISCCVNWWNLTRPQGQATGIICRDRTTQWWTSIRTTGKGHTGEIAVRLE